MDFDAMDVGARATCRAPCASAAATAERRRAGRRDLDRVGRVEWFRLLIAALFAAPIAAALALRAG